MSRGIYLTKGNVFITTKPPVPLNSRSVRLKPKYAGICGSDIFALHTLDDSKVIRGHEITGVVTEVGTEVQSICVGDNVGRLEQFIYNHR